MFDADQVIYETVWAALPNCTLSRRRIVLLALQQKIQREHPAQKNVTTQLALLNSLDALQEQLPFTPKQETHKNNGQ